MSRRLIAAYRIGALLTLGALACRSAPPDQAMRPRGLPFGLQVLLWAACNSLAGAAVGLAVGFLWSLAKAAASNEKVIPRLGCYLCRELPAVGVDKGVKLGDVLHHPKCPEVRANAAPQVEAGNESA